MSKDGTVEHIHICMDLEGICVRAARDFVEGPQHLFKSYSELVRAAVTDYYQRFREREVRLRTTGLFTDEAEEYDQR